MNHISDQLHLDFYRKASDSGSAVSMCRLVVLILFVAILTTAVSISIQTQKRHETYRTLQTLKKDLATMQVEQERLLIEQQTFSATPQVARRAVKELGMFFPSREHRKVITPAKTDKDFP